MLNDIEKAKNTRRLYYALVAFTASLALFVWVICTTIPEPLLMSPNVPDMPAASEDFDCDDSALFMYDYFTAKGYECVIVTGNLELEKETFFECNHMWVIVICPNEASIAYDWGSPCYDRQHFEGFIITYEQLEGIVATD